MRKNIRLYINNQEVDCSEDMSLPITYTIEDFKNPTVVKNSFSKTITIPGTKQNNKIFGEIYKLDRFIADHPYNTAGVKFDPSKRVDFQLFNNGSLVESGYMQLNTISVQDNIIKYNITLYGGLGDFFYNLKYREDGEQKTLADLQYFVEDSGGIVLDSDKEFDFKINKKFVNECFNHHPEDDMGNTLKDFITFAPSYNGLYENFDNETCLINTNNDNIFPKSFTSDSTTYSTYNGYGLAKLNKSYTEWEMRDLRSYKQRPALKLSKLIKTICRKENSGYDVNFDPEFFNDGNPYWSKTYVALPLLGSNETEESENKDEGKIVKYDDKFWIGTKDSEELDANSGTLVVEDSDIITSLNGTVNMSNLPSGSLTDIDLPIQIKFNPIDDYTQDDKFYLSYVLNGTSGSLVYKNHPVRTSFVAQIMIYDMDDPSTLLNPVAYSPIYNFTSATIGGAPLSGPGTWYNYYPWTDAPVETIPGYFEYIDGSFVFKSDAGSNIFHLITKNIPKLDKALYTINIARYSEGIDNVLPLWSAQSIAPGAVSNYTTNGSIEVLWDQNKYSLTSEWGSTVASDILINKKTLLRTESTPADFLLSYSKIFGLYFVKDIDSKTINIYTRNNFFKNEIEDWSGRIDYSKDFTINPILFEKKWYKLAAETPDTYYASKYNKEYNITYGQKRLDTGYNFNAETEDLYSDNIYENIITARDISKYYRNFYTSNDEYAPAFLNDNATYTLYNNVGGVLNDSDQEIYGANHIDVSKTVEWNNIPGNDIYSKLCFFTLDGDEKSLSEIKTSLIMFNGYSSMYDINDNPINYYITDDLSEMSILNSGEFCYLYTNNEYDVNDNQIAIKCGSLPVFSRYISNQGSISHSLDFGLPKEIFVNLDYNESTTIYNKFWDKFYKDQLSVNTKKVTCFVKMNDLWVNNEMLRKFYYFDNAYWLLNKIEGYDINSDITTRCEFIKVQDIGSYISGIPFLGEYMVFEPQGPITVDHNAGSTKVTINTNVDWEISYYTGSKISRISPDYGTPGKTDITITYTKNSGYDDDLFYFRVVRAGNTSGPAIDIIQTPNPSNVITITGEVTYSTTKSDEWSPHICASNDNFINCVYVRESNKYKLYAPINQDFDIEIQGQYGAVLQTKTIQATDEDIVINWEI